MKRFATFVAPTLLTGVLLGIGSASLAQSNIMELVGLPTGLVTGHTYHVDLFVTPAAVDSAISVVQPTIVYESGVFSPITFTPQANVPNGSSITNIQGDVVAPTTAASGGNAPLSGSFDGTARLKRITDGLLSDSGTGGAVIGVRSLIGSFDFKVSNTAGLGPTRFGISSVIFGYTSNSNKAFVSSSPNAPTTFLNGDSGTILVRTPGPSSLAVFAMGGLAPIMGLIRRRRAAK